MAKEIGGGGGGSKQIRPKQIINHFLLGQAPLQLNQLLSLPKFNKQTDTVGKEEKMLNVYHHILDGYWTTSLIQFQGYRAKGNLQAAKLR